MARDEAPPWGRGASYYNGGTIDQSSLGGWNFCGKEYRFEDTTYGTNQYVTVRAVRNTGSFPLLPGRLCAFDPNYPTIAINGYQNNANGPGVIVDEFLTNGLQPGDVGYVIMRGPTLALAPLDGGADNVIAILDPLVAIAAATTGATTAGRLASAGTAGATLPRDEILNVIGRALSAKTTGNTGAQVLVNVRLLF